MGEPNFCACPGKKTKIHMKFEFYWELKPNHEEQLYIAGIGISTSLHSY